MWKCSKILVLILVSEDCWETQKSLNVSVESVYLKYHFYEIRNKVSIFVSILKLRL